MEAATKARPLPVGVLRAEQRQRERSGHWAWIVLPTPIAAREVGRTAMPHLIPEFMPEKAVEQTIVLSVWDDLQ